MLLRFIFVRCSSYTLRGSNPYYVLVGALHYLCLLWGLNNANWRYLFYNCFFSSRSSPDDPRSACDYLGSLISKTSFQRKRYSSAPVNINSIVRCFCEKSHTNICSERALPTLAPDWLLFIKHDSNAPTNGAIILILMAPLTRIKNANSAS
jgi:hypothetical protein